MKLDLGKVLVTGGTGSFGHYVADHLLAKSDSEITIFSRDEYKQYQMGLKYKGNPRLHFMIGDVRDERRVAEAMRGVDTVFHAAALKQVPSCENHPFEAVRTNVFGAKNVAEAAIDAGAKRVIAVSTDKAVKPVNAMGMTKALQEKIMLESNFYGDTHFNVVRYGNIVGSRGSVVPLFMDSIREGTPMPITQEDMTRFWLTLDDAINLIMYAATSGDRARLYVKKAPACRIIQVARVVAGKMGKPGYPTMKVGLRKGEKVHEVLVAENEMITAVDAGDYYVIRPYEPVPADLSSQGSEYTSANTRQLSDDEISKLIDLAMSMKGASNRA